MGQTLHAAETAEADAVAAAVAVAEAVQSRCISSVVCYCVHSICDLN